MSEINDDKPRARRRAKRSAGPPPAETVGTGTGTAPEAGTPDGGAEPAVADSAAAKAVAATTPSGEKAGSAEAAPVAVTRSAEPLPAGETPPAEAASAGGTAPTATDAPESETELDVPPPASHTESAETGAVEAPPAKVALEKDGDDAAPEPAAPASAWKRTVLTAAAALATIAIVTTAILTTLGVRANDARDERRNEYLQTARQTVLNLTTIRADSAREDIDRILSVASGDFKTEFDGRVDPFTDIVQQAKVVSTGEIVEAALERDDENSAQVLVAAKQTLTNAGQAEPQTRYYRFRITVTRGDEGLTASKVEFVA